MEARRAGRAHYHLVHLIARDGHRLVGEACDDVRRERVVAQAGPEHLAVGYLLPCRIVVSAAHYEQISRWLASQTNSALL